MSTRLIKEENVARKMLSIIRESEENKKNKFVIKKNTPQFGDIRTSQEEALVSTIGEKIDLEEDALVYYSKEKKLVLTGKVGGLGMAFQFVFNDPSGDGCYFWANSLQLTDANERTIGKIRDSFLNWKATLTKDADLMDKLEKEANK